MRTKKNWLAIKKKILDNLRCQFSSFPIHLCATNPHEREDARYGIPSIQTQNEPTADCSCPSRIVKNNHTSSPNHTEAFVNQRDNKMVLHVTGCGNVSAASLQPKSPGYLNLIAAGFQAKRETASNFFICRITDCSFPVKTSCLCATEHWRNHLHPQQAVNWQAAVQTCDEEKRRNDHCNKPCVCVCNIHYLQQIVSCSKDISIKASLSTFLVAF